jgi:antitoxin CptB
MTSSIIRPDGSPDRLDARRRRLLFRAWRRGMREMDLILGRFAEARLAALPDRDLSDMERLMDVPDQDLFAWVTGAVPVAASYDTPVFRAIVAFHDQGRRPA